MVVFLALVGMLGIPISLVLLLIAAIRKRPKKKFAIAALVCFSSFVVALIIVPTPDKSNVTAEGTASPAVSNTVQTSTPAIRPNETEQIKESAPPQITVPSQEPLKPSPTIEPESVYYLEVYNNADKYIGSYVKVVGPVSYVSSNTISIKGELTGATEMLTITVRDKSVLSNISEGDYITVVGLIDAKTVGYLYVKDATIEQNHDEAKKLFESQKESYSKIQDEKIETEKDEFISKCGTKYDYKDLIRNPSTHQDGYIQITMTVLQKMDGGLFDSNTYYRCKNGENEFIVCDLRENSEPKLLSDDVIIVYGKFEGTMEMTRSITKEEVEIPLINMSYVTLK